jgi:branched-chain amino acid aminotransferase
MKSTFLISVNGKISAADDAVIPALDRGFLYGDSIYEATRTFDKKIFHWDFHLERLYKSAEKINLKITYQKEELTKLIQDIVDIHPAKNVSLRIQLSRGTNKKIGLSKSQCLDKNNVIIFADELKPNPEWWIQKGLSLTSFTLHTQKTGSLAKSGSYLENMLAYDSALENGFHDSILLNKEGHVLEGTTSNIWFIDQENRLCTPDIELGLLDGITRRVLFKIFKENKMDVIEGSFTINDLLKAREVFITSSSRFIVPVTSIHHKIIGSGEPGKLTLKLLELYMNEIKKEYRI